jgi:hypothetical protein
MAIPKLEKDVKIISKIPDYPGSQGGLSTEAFRAKFDEAAQIIKDYINYIMIPKLDELVDVDALIKGILDATLTEKDKAAQAKAVGDELKRKFDKTGGSITGAMTIQEPTVAANPATKKYVDGKYMFAMVELPASGWSADAPYVQTVDVPGILDTDRPHYGVVYTDNWEAEKAAFAAVDDLDTADGSVTFICFEEKPEADLTIQLEVNR